MRSGKYEAKRHIGRIQVDPGSRSDSAYIGDPFIQRPQMVGYVVHVKGYLGMGRLRIYGRYLKGGTEPTEKARGRCLAGVSFLR
jgi:hypothetical protein